MYNKEWGTDYKGICENCHKSFIGGEKYCFFCGTKRGDRKFDPYLNLMQGLYGPMPVERVRKCTKCKKTWTTLLMVDQENSCPDCGAPSKIIEENGKKKETENQFLEKKTEIRF